MARGSGGACGRRVRLRIRLFQRRRDAPDDVRRQQHADLGLRRLDPFRLPPQPASETLGVFRRRAGGGARAGAGDVLHPRLRADAHVHGNADDAVAMGAQHAGLARRGHCRDRPSPDAGLAGQQRGCAERFRARPRQRARASQPARGALAGVARNAGLLDSAGAAAVDRSDRAGPGRAPPMVGARASALSAGDVLERAASGTRAALERRARRPPVLDRRGTRVPDPLQQLPGGLVPGVSS